MSIQSDADAGFYAIVQELLESERKSYRSDRRTQARQPFDCQLLVAPYADGRMPTGPDFRKVQCQNLSACGMSFLDDQPPKHPQLLVLLGAAPFTIVMAEVVRQTPATKDALDGRYLIGCRFNGRLDQRA